MKAKRLTALALAAVMAASSMSVSFAAPTEDLVLDFAGSQLYKEDEDGYIVPASGMDDFRPGDSIYLQLDEYPNASVKDINKVKAHAEWEIGKSWVEKVSIAVKRGEGTSTSVTNYSIQGLTGAFADLNDKPLSSNSLDELKRVVEGSQIYKDELQKLLDSQKYMGVAYSADDGKTWLKDKSAAASAAFNAKKTAGDIVEVNSYVIVDNNKYKTLPANIVPAADTGYIVDSTYFANAGEAIAKSGWFKYDSTYEGVKQLYATDAVAETGSLTESANSNTLATDGTIYVNAAADNPTAATTYISTSHSNIPSVISAISKATTNDYYDSGKANAVVTVEIKSEKAYFDKMDKFLGVAGEESKIGETYIKTDNKHPYDGNGNPTDTNAAKTAATDELNKQLNLSTNNIGSKTTGAGGTSARYYWFKIDTKKSASTKDIDVYGDLYLSTSSSLSSAKRNGNHISVDITLTNADPDNTDHEDVDGSATVEPGERAVLTFAKDAEEVEIEFGDDARFEFNARGQGKLNFAYNTKYNREFARDYESANIDFITFEGEPTANRTGTLYIYVDPEDKGYIYEVTEDGAKKISGAKYDKDEGAWVIRTRKLTSYAISDKKLKTVDEMGTSSSSGTTGGSTSRPIGSTGKPNPDTGR